MSDFSYKQMHQAVWHPAGTFFSRRAPHRIRAWLTDRNSLTQQVICHCQGQFSVNVLRQYWQRPLINEASKLGINRNNIAFIREVHLNCNNQPWVFARTVIPINTLQGELQTLTQLGTQPLGAVLFSNHLIKRSPLEIACFHPHTTMYNEAVQQTSENGSIWGRRSLFLLGNSPLLVNELFLNHIPAKQP